MPSWCCCARFSAAGTRSPRSVTHASRSTAGAARARATCSGSPRTSRPGAAARPPCGCCPPASATPGGSSTRPPRCRRDCARPRLVCPGWSPPRGAQAAARSSARCWRPRRTRQPGWPASSPGYSASRPAPRRTGVPGPTAATTRYARPTSPCCAVSGHSSPRCAPRSRHAASRSRWSGWAGCSPCRRSRTSSPRCGSCTTRARPTRWPGCSPARGGGSGRGTWSRSAAGPASSPARRGCHPGHRRDRLPGQLRHSCPFLILM